MFYLLIIISMDTRMSEELVSVTTQCPGFATEEDRERAVLKLEAKQRLTKLHIDWVKL